MIKEHNIENKRTKEFRLSLPPWTEGQMAGKILVTQTVGQLKYLYNLGNQSCDKLP